MLRQLFYSAIAASVLLLATDSPAWGRFVVSLDPDDLTILGPGPVSKSVDLFVRREGTEPATFNILEFDFTLPNQISVQNQSSVGADPITNPLGFSQAGVFENAVGFTLIGTNVDLSTFPDSTARLTTLQFLVADTVTTGEFPVDFTLVNAFRTSGFIQTPIDSEFSFEPATFEVTAIPEPSSVALLTGLAGISGWKFRRRKRCRVELGRQQSV